MLKIHVLNEPPIIQMNSCNIQMHSLFTRSKMWGTFSVKDRYQLNYFICIKDFNAETNTSLKSSKENDLPLCIYF
jgi:hypothetical protein